MMSFGAFNLLFQDSYDVKRVDHDLQVKTPRSYLKLLQTLTTRNRN
jgi:hypothetical protein